MKFVSECDDYPLNNQYIIEMWPLGGTYLYGSKVLTVEWD
jgi:hypothetical protein